MAKRSLLSRCPSCKMIHGPYNVKFFWDVTRLVLVFPYRRFRTTYLSHIQGQRSLTLGDWANILSKYYQYTLRKVPDVFRGEI